MRLFKDYFKRQHLRKGLLIIDNGESANQCRTLKLLELVLPCINFDFDNTKVANIFMADFLETDVCTFDTNLLLWKQFIDDCICLHVGTQKDFDGFVNDLNKCHPIIKFTGQIKVNFLDATLHMTETWDLWTGLYTKPTVTHDCLEKSKSVHPCQSKWSLPYSQPLGLRRICSRNSDFVKLVLIMLYHFKRGAIPTRSSMMH